MKRMGHAGRLLVSSLLLLLLAGSSARAEFFVLDQSKADRLPEKFGYTVDVMDEGGSLRIVLKMGKEGTKAFQSAEIHGKFTPLVLDTQGDVTTVNVSVRKKDLATCVLRLRTKPLHSAPKPGTDFKGYDLVLHTLKVNKQASATPKRPATLKKPSAPRYRGKRAISNRAAGKTRPRRRSPIGNPLLGSAASDASQDTAFRSALVEYRQGFLRDSALKTLKKNPERVAYLVMDGYSLQLLDLYKDADAPDDAQIDGWFQRHKETTWPRIEDVCKALGEDAAAWCLRYAKGRQYWEKGRYRSSGPGGKNTKPVLQSNQQIKVMYLFHANLTKKGGE